MQIYENELFVNCFMFYFFLFFLFFHINGRTITIFLNWILFVRCTAKHKTKVKTCVCSNYLVGKAFLACVHGGVSNSRVVIDEKTIAFNARNDADKSQLLYSCLKWNRSVWIYILNLCLIESMCVAHCQILTTSQSLLIKSMNVMTANTRAQRVAKWQEWVLSERQLLSCKTTQKNPLLAREIVLCVLWMMSTVVIVIDVGINGIPYNNEKIANRFTSKQTKISNNHKRCENGLFFLYVQF